MDEINPRISIYYAQNATVVTLADEKILEDEDIKAIESSIMPVIDGPINLVIDFSEVVFLSSAVLGLLIRISKKVNEQNGKLRLCSIGSKIYDIFKITRLDEVFEICDNAKKAIQSLA